MSNTVNDSAIKKLKLLFTVVDRPKGEFYLDVISQFDVNCQLILGGLGTATSELVELLGLEPHKAVILSVVREDMVDTIMNTLEEKFATIRNGKGISFAVPLLILGLPLFDAIFAMIRRIYHGKSPMAADRGHLHHRLIDMGFSQKQTVFIP